MSARVPTETPRAEDPPGTARGDCRQLSSACHAGETLWRPSGRTSPKVPSTGATVQTEHLEGAPLHVTTKHILGTYGKLFNGNA